MDFHALLDESKKKICQKKTLIILAVSTILLIFIIIIIIAVAVGGSEELNDPVVSRKKLPGVEYHTIEEVKKRIVENTPTSSEVSYKSQPSWVSPFKIGRLSDKTLNNALLVLNNFRYIAGIPSTVTLSEKYNELAQAASVLMAANKKGAHTGQPQPSGMDKSIYDLGVTGCSSCNIYFPLKDLNYGIRRWIQDNEGNFKTLGHRRWILNPPMKSTGFGLVNEYGTLYCFDNQNVKTEYYGVAWPGQNTPLSYFNNGDAWSYSLGKVIITNDIKVTLKNLKDGKVYTFDKSDTNTFVLSNNNYGLQGCIGFLPSLSYSDGDTFEVGIHGTEVNVDYTVHFFDL